MKDRINKAISKFETKNLLSIREYRTFDEDKTEDKKKLDNYIAESVFYDRINNWLKICNDSESIDEFLRLLSNYNYFTRERFEDGFEELAKRVIKRTRIDFDRIMIVTVSSKSNCVSGGDKIRAAIEVFAKGKMNKDKNIYLSHQKIKDDENVELVVFFDDVIGSGKTIYGAVEQFYFYNRWLDKKKVYICCLCGRDDKFKDKTKQLRHIGLDVQYLLLYPLKKCYASNPLTGNEALIRSYEQRINSTENRLANDSEGDCTMGFGECKLLVSFFYETPNDTLSIFWRKTKISPNPVFMRMPRDKRDLTWFKNRQNELRNMSYRYFRAAKKREMRSRKYE